MTDTKKFSLKDHLFNKEILSRSAREIKAAYSDFNQRAFEARVLERFPELELMERIYRIRDNLTLFLPKDFRTATNILLASLPPHADPEKTDGDFGNFVYAPYSYFVAEHGCSKKDLMFSLQALKELTTRFSAEGPIRHFINAFPRETLQTLERWSRDSHYHVRRLASEGTRPKLPWAKNIHIAPKQVVPILDNLFYDTTRFVTRSVANHVNDISKGDPTLALSLLKKWRKTNKQDEKEMEYITRHALRTLVKEGNVGALTLLGYTAPAIRVQDFKMLTPKVSIGESLKFSFNIKSTADKPQNLMVDYILYFMKARGKQAPKTFKVGKKHLRGGETLSCTKKHPLRIMTTRKLYPGIHTVELQINGESFGKKDFVLTTA